MSSGSRRASSRAVSASDASGGWSALPDRVALAAVLAFSLLALGAIAVPGRAQAAGSGAKITFAAPIYAGQNNGYAEGPVGTFVTVQGSGWTAGGGNVTITLADEQNDSGQPGSACTNGSSTVSIPGFSSQPVDGSGNFMTATFQWPAAAGTKGHDYWACGTQGGAKSTGVDKFFVLSANPPSLSLASTTAVPGSVIAVSGTNWLPGGVNIIVIIAPCVACEPPYASNAQVTASGSGTFSVDVQVPQAAPVGTTLYASAQNVDSGNPPNDGALTTGTSTSAQFTVASDATPTVTPTVTPTPGATLTATAPANAGVSSGNNTNGSSGTMVLIVLLAALGLVLVMGAIIAIVLFMRSRGPTPGGSGRGGPPYGGGGYGPPGNQYGGPRQSRGYGPPSYPNTNDDYYNGPPPRLRPARPGPGKCWRLAR